MNETNGLSRRRTLLMLGAAVAAAGPLPATVGADGAAQPAGSERRVPAVIRKIIVEQLGVDEPKVTWEARFVEDLGADSLDTVELVMAFEEEFKIEIPDEDTEKIVRVGHLVEYLRKRKALK